uniref:G-protein coupled receptors family 1 profile domain-containing protein n=1 Tax=Parascaris equorum TaxID=6256 RepID=A0A914RPL0_PAREQ
MKPFPNCSDFFRSMSVSLTEWAVDSQAYYIFDVHIISFAQTRRRARRKQLRCAVYTMVAIVCTHLVSNSLHLLLTALERSGTKILVDDYDPNVSSSFYIAFSDTVSFCYMFTSAIRIVIYALCNPTLGRQIVDFLKGKTHSTMKQDFDRETSSIKSQMSSR